MSTPPDIIAARRLNQVKYAIEDFDEGVGDFYKVAFVNGVLALALGLSLIFAADNAGHLALSLLTAAACLVISRLDFMPRSSLLSLTVGVVLLLLAEAITLGFPDLILPFLNLREYTGAPVVLNHTTPYVYWVGKLYALVVVCRLWYLRARVAAQPEDLRRRALGNRPE